jgi:hypothetical protein
VALEPVTLIEGFREYRVAVLLTEEDLAMLRAGNHFPLEERPGKVVLDLTGVTPQQAAPLSEMARVIDFRYDEEKPPFIAIIVTRAFQFGLTMQLAAYQGVAHRMRPFFSRDEALAWLGEMMAEAGPSLPPT